MSLIRKHVAVLQAWACLALVEVTSYAGSAAEANNRLNVRPFCQSVVA